MLKKQFKDFWTIWLLTYQVLQQSFHRLPVMGSTSYVIHWRQKNWREGVKVEQQKIWYIWYLLPLFYFFASHSYIFFSSYSTFSCKRLFYSCTVTNSELVVRMFLWLTCCCTCMEVLSTLVRGECFKHHLSLLRWILNHQMGVVYWLCSNRRVPPPSLFLQTYTNTCKHWPLLILLCCFCFMLVCIRYFSPAVYLPN